jgi:hypothetical protein
MNCWSAEILREPTLRDRYASAARQRLLAEARPMARRPPAPIIAVRRASAAARATLARIAALPMDSRQGLRSKERELATFGISWGTNPTDDRLLAEEIRTSLAPPLVAWRHRRPSAGCPSQLATSEQALDGTPTRRHPMATPRTFVAPGQRYAEADKSAWRSDHQLTVVHVACDDRGRACVTFRCPNGDQIVLPAAHFEAVVAAGQLVPVIGAGLIAHAA